MTLPSIEEQVTQILEEDNESGRKFSLQYAEEELDYLVPYLKAQKPILDKCRQFNREPPIMILLTEEDEGGSEVFGFREDPNLAGKYISRNSLDVYGTIVAFIDSPVLILLHELAHHFTSQDGEAPGHSKEWMNWFRKLGEDMDLEVKANIESDIKFYLEKEEVPVNAR